MAVREAAKPTQQTRPVGPVRHLSPDERQAMGSQAAERTPPSSHFGWQPAQDRPDPVALLEEQNTTREPDLVPVRHGRMMVSPFTFYRGAAKIMAADLKDTPVAGLDAQLCGDAHLSNFGMFASPERALLFDLNDFDETLPGPFEFDVKRMAASFLIAGRNNGFSKADARAAALASVMSYRESMADFAQMPTMEIWYAHFEEDRFRAIIRDALAEVSPGVKEPGVKDKKAKAAKPDKKVKAATKKEQKEAKQAEVVQEAARRAEKNLEKAHTRDSMQALAKLGELVDGHYQIVSQPPVIVPGRDLAATYGLSPDEVTPAIHEQFRAYRATLQDDRRGCWRGSRSSTRHARSSGSAASGPGRSSCLLQGRDEQDPLFLQVKEATASVLEAYLPKSRYQQPRRTGGAGPAADAGRQRHLPGLDQGNRRRPATSTGASCAT